VGWSPLRGTFEAACVWSDAENRLEYRKGRRHLLCIRGLLLFIVGCFEVAGRDARQPRDRMDEESFVIPKSSPRYDLDFGNGSHRPPFNILPCGRGADAVWLHTLHYFSNFHPADAARGWAGCCRGGEH